MLPKALAQGASEIRGQLPIQVDQITKMVGVVTVGSDIIYQMTIDEDIPSDQIENVRQTIDSSNRQKSCSNAEVSKLIQMGASLTWNYTDQNGDTFKVTVGYC